MAKKETVVGIQPVQIGRMEVPILGLTPLICHRNTAKLPGDPDYDTRSKKDPRTPEERMHDACYLAPGTNWEDQQFVFPGVGIKKALVSAGGRFSSYDMTYLRGVVSVDREWLSIQSEEPPEKLSVPVRLTLTAMERRHRPIWRNWKMVLPIRFLANHISANDVFNLIELAGLTIGIGDWRPESKNGTYGTFQIDRAIEARIDDGKVQSPG